MKKSSLAFFALTEIALIGAFITSLQATSKLIAESLKTESVFAQVILSVLTAISTVPLFIGMAVMVIEILLAIVIIALSSKGKGKGLCVFCIIINVLAVFPIIFQAAIAIELGGFYSVWLLFSVLSVLFSIIYCATAIRNISRCRRKNFNE